MRLKLIPILIICVLKCYSQSDMAYSRTNKYGHLKLSAKDFKELITSIKYYADEYKSKDDSIVAGSIHCTFKKNKKALYVQSFNDIANVDLDDKAYDYVYLKYEYENKNAALLVEVLLEDSRREIFIGGTDEKKIDALYREIDERLRLNEQTGWWEAIPLSILAISLIVLIVGICYLAIISKKLDRPKLIMLTLMYFLLMIFSLGISIKSWDWFPGFTLSKDNPAFYEKYGPEMGFIGFILSIIGAITPVVVWVRKKLVGIAKSNPLTTQANLANKSRKRKKSHQQR